MINLLEKLSKAKNLIQSESLNKNAKNDFSGYRYFSPEYVEHIVQKAASKFNLYTKFDLLRNEFGEYGQLAVYDLESGEVIRWEMASAVPSIKATNQTQQLGGAVTYTERYLKMTAFGIVDNSSDFDTTENTKSRNSEIKKTESELPWLNILDASKNFTPQWLNVIDAINNGNLKSLDQIRIYYKVSKETETKLKELLNL